VQIACGDFKIVQEYLMFFLYYSGFSVHGVAGAGSLSGSCIGVSARGVTGFSAVNLRVKDRDMTIALLYIALCLLIALVGVNRKFGFWGYFFCSFFLTPPIGALLILASDPRPKPRQARKSCDCSASLQESTTKGQ